MAESVEQFNPPYNPILRGVGAGLIGLIGVGLPLTAATYVFAERGDGTDLIHDRQELLVEQAKADEANVNYERQTAAIGEACVSVINNYMPGGKFDTSNGPAYRIYSHHKNGIMDGDFRPNIVTNPREAEVIDEVLSTKVCGTTKPDVRTNIQSHLNSVLEVQKAKFDLDKTRDEIKSLEHDVKHQSRWYLAGLIGGLIVGAGALIYKMGEYKNKNSKFGLISEWYIDRALNYKQKPPKCTRDEMVNALRSASPRAKRKLLKSRDADFYYDYSMKVLKKSK